MTGGLRVRLLADMSKGERVRRWDPETGRRYLFNPATGQEEPWPLLAAVPVGDLPDVCTVSGKFLRDAMAKGWASGIGARLVHRPGGPPDDPWRVTHTFEHLDAVVFHFADGDVEYRVAQQPDKQHPNRPGQAGEVWWAYTLERVR